MSDESLEFEAGELLRAVGEVRTPEPGVLEAAREVLWSAIATEMLGTGTAGGQTATGGEELEEHRTTQRRHADPQGERKISMGGGEAG
jgi:hypothetical protein